LALIVDERGQSVWKRGSGRNVEEGIWLREGNGGVLAEETYRPTLFAAAQNLLVDAP